MEARFKVTLFLNMTMSHIESDFMKSSIFKYSLPFCHEALTSGICYDAEVGEGSEACQINNFQNRAIQGIILNGMVLERNTAREHFSQLLFETPQMSLSQNLYFLKLYSSLEQWRTI